MLWFCKRHACLMRKCQHLCFPRHELLHCISAQTTSAAGLDTAPFSLMLCTAAAHPSASILQLYATPPDGIEVTHARFPLCQVISVYKRPSASISQLTAYLRDMLAVHAARGSPPSVLIGDFNVDLLSKTPSTAASAFVAFMEGQGLRQVVTHATTINGSLLDHIWTHVAHCEARQFVAPHSGHSYISLCINTA